MLFQRHEVQLVWLWKQEAVCLVKSSLLSSLICGLAISCHSLFIYCHITRLGKHSVKGIFRMNANVHTMERSCSTFIISIVPTVRSLFMDVRVMQHILSPAFVTAKLPIVYIAVFHVFQWEGEPVLVSGWIDWTNLFQLNSVACGIHNPSWLFAWLCVLWQSWHAGSAVSVFVHN